MTGCVLELCRILILSRTLPSVTDTTGRGQSLANHALLCGVVEDEAFSFLCQILCMKRNSILKCEDDIFSKMVKPHLDIK